MDKHTLQKIYLEVLSLENQQSWAVVCSCGWKEKAKSENEARRYLDQHIKRPNK